MPRFIIYLLITLGCLNAHAQTYVPFTHINGIKTVSGVNIKTTPIGDAISAAAYTRIECQPYFDAKYQVATANPGAFSYSFWPKIKRLRLHIDGIDISDTVRVFINGSPYTFTSANIVSPICGGLAPLIHLGNLVSTTGPPRSAQVVINTTTAFDSMRLFIASTTNSGVSYDIAYALPDSGINIYEPFGDTAFCVGDTMTVGYASPYAFNSGNTVTIQLSDAGGSFATPQTIALLNTSDASGFTKWVIPPMAAGGNYRLRAVSSQPYFVSLPTDKGISIGVRPASVEATANSPVCEGHTLNLNTVTPASGFSYSWSSFTSFWTASGKDVTRTPVTAAMTGQYVVKVSSFGCHKYDTVDVTVNPGPGPIAARSNSPVCTGDTLKLGASINEISGTTYTWSGPGGMPAYTDTAVKHPNVFAGGNYVITASLYNCTSSDTVAVAVFPKPINGTPINNGPVCEGDTIRLTGYGLTGANYLWRGPGGYLNPSQFPKKGNALVADSGWYVLTVSANGCSGRDSTFVKIKPMPDTPVATVNSPLCVGDLIALSVPNNKAGVVYSWKGPGINWPNQQSGSRVAGAGSSGNYVVTVDLNGCSLSDTVNALVRSKPNPVAFSNGVICEGDTVELIAHDTIKNVTFSWVGPDGFTSPDQSVTRPKAVPAMSGSYIVTTKNFDCTNSDTVSVTVKPLPPIPGARNNSPVCEGDELLFTLDTTVTGSTYSWSGAGGFSSTEPMPAIKNTGLNAMGKYKVVVNLNGCVSEDTTSVFVKPKPTLDVSNNSPIAMGNPLIFKVGPELPGTAYTWTGPNGFYSRAKEPIITRATPAAAGEYTVVATLEGCTTANIMIVVISDVEDTGKFVFYPNPNSGTFNVGGTARAEQPVSLEVTNSVGQTVYNTVLYTRDKILKARVEMPFCASGVYTLRFRVDGKMHTFPFVLSR